MKHCSACGALVSLKIPAGDNRERSVCDDCGTVHYQNPKLVAGCIPVWDEQILLCRRAIEPRYGLWTLPAGFMENGETTEQAGERETLEEARENLIEAVELVLEANRELARESMAGKTVIREPLILSGV